MKYTNEHFILNSNTLLDGILKINNLSDNSLCLFIVNEEEKLLGTLTDGDIRRAIIMGIDLNASIEKAMRKDFEKILENDLSPLKIKIFKQKGISLLPCLDKSGIIKKVYNLKDKQTILPIDAVLMAGGKGVRLRPLTEKTPKPLLKVGSKAIIDHNIDSLITFGVENFHINVNYLAEQIENHFSNDKRNININCVREPEYLGTIGSVKFIKEFNNDNVLIMNSDVFTNIDFEDFYINHENTNADISVATVPYSVSVPYGIFELDQRKIIGIKEKPSYNYYANGGIYLVKKAVLNLIPKDKYFDATDLIQLSINKKLNVINFPIIGYWIDIGQHEDYKKVQEFVKHIKY